MNTLRMSFLALRRDWRAGEVRLMALALILSVGAMTTVGFFTDRVRLAMEEQAATLLAADLALDSLDPLPGAFTRKADHLGLNTAQTIYFRSMAAAGDELRLAEVKAVAESYPLRGRLAVTKDIDSPPVITDRVPEPGSVWMDARLLHSLNRKVGATIELGVSQFTITEVLTSEPDRGGEVFHIAPRLMMNIVDLPATKLLIPGSRARYRLLIAGERAPIQEYRAWVKSRIGPEVSLLSVKDAQPQLRTTLERAGQFLGLMALTSVILAGIVIAATAGRFAARHMDHCAIMRCMGATQRRIMQIYIYYMLWLGLITALLGCLLGLAAQSVLAMLMTNLIADELPRPSLTPLLSGTMTGLIALLGFALPQLIRLKDIPPSRVLRREATDNHGASYLIYVAAALAITGLVAWQTQDPTLTGYILAGSIATLLLLGLVSWLLINCLRPLCSRVGVAWRFGITNIARRARDSVVQIVALGLGILVLLILSVVRNDLLSDWQASLPPDAPNHFAINIQPHEAEAIRRFFSDKGIPAPKLYPIAHGRLAAINGEPIDPAKYRQQRARRLAMREFHITWLARPPEDNLVIAGSWWSPGDHPKQLSMESEIAETLGLSLGDTLTFRVTGQELSARITNLRSVEWDTLNPNFFVITPPGFMDEHQETYLTSFYLPAEDKPLLTELIKNFPSITILDIAALVQQLQSITNRVVSAMEFMFMFTLAIGLLVLFAGLQAAHDERQRESAVLRAFGASKKTIIRGLIAEFLSLGVLTGLLAAAGASATSFLLATYVFDISYHFNPWLFFWGLLIGGLGVGLSGYLGTRRVLHVPPLQTLRMY